MSERVFKRLTQKMIKFHPEKSVKDNFAKNKKVCLIGIDDKYRVGIIEEISSQRPNIIKPHELRFKVRILDSKNEPTKNVILVEGQKIIRYMPKWLWYLKTTFPQLITEKDFEK